MRIAPALARAGLGSRRRCEEYVLEGAVTVNGEPVTDLGRQVDCEMDEIFFRGRPLRFVQYVYYILHKPEGYLTSAFDPHHTKTVFDLLPKILVRATREAGLSRTRVFAVGRLDKDSSGLLLFTNDGELANRLIHPRYQVERWYEVRLNRAYESVDLSRILKGVRLREGMAQVKKLQTVSRRVLRVCLCEGKNREVRRVFGKLGYTVTRLKRIAFAGLRLSGLEEGHGRFLTKGEIAILKKHAAALPSIPVKGS